MLVTDTSAAMLWQVAHSDFVKFSDIVKWLYFPAIYGSFCVKIKFSPNYLLNTLSSNSKSIKNGREEDYFVILHLTCSDH